MNRATIMVNNNKKMSWRLESQNLSMCIVKTSSQKGARIKSYDEGFQQVSNC